MNLIDGLILHTFNEVNIVSQHSMLMRFYKIQKKVNEAYNENYKKAFHSMPIYFMQIEAKAILKTLNIF